MTFQGKQQLLISDGTYPAILTEVFSYENDHGRRYGFRFILQAHTCYGVAVTQTASANIAPKSRLTEIISGLNRGKMLVPGRFQELVGTRCIVLITKQVNRNGETFNTVEKVLCGPKSC